MRSVHVVSHPLVQHNLALLRDKRTKPPEFRRLLGEIATLMVFKATESFATRPRKITTPMGPATGSELRNDILVVPVLRAGLGMANAILQVIPQAQVGFVGLKRDEKTLKPVTYHESLPKNLSRFEILLVDPMLATGGSTIAALDLLHERDACHVRMINLVCAPEGIRAVRARYPRLAIYSAAIDTRLNERGFIIPGLGDAGDRLFGV